MNIRILVVDDQPVVRAGVAQMIGTQPDLKVVGDAADGLLAVSKAVELRPDVVVMDVRMPRLNGIEATRRLVGLRPKPPRVVLLTTFDLDEYVFDGLFAGASGFLLKHAPPEEILLAMRAAAAGDALVSPAPMRRLVEHFVRGRPRTSADLARLTEREREVLVLMARGLSNAAIARTLVIAETTAKTHVTRILAKLGLRDRAHAVVYAYETGLVRPGERTDTEPRPSAARLGNSTPIPPHFP
jgi:DNA-binding NarL/FixJ family response regulator